MEDNLIYITADTIISSLGFTTQENLEAIKAYSSGIVIRSGERIADTQIPAALIDEERFQTKVKQDDLGSYSRLEQLFILAIKDILLQSGASLEDASCGLILSTTKGNVDLLRGHTDDLDEGVYLWQTAGAIAGYFNMARQKVHLISNACISGLSAMIVGKRLIESGVYKQLIVAGGDVLSHFISSGFRAFKSVSEEVCRPYDVRRDGLSLGEACGAMLLTTECNANGIVLAGGAISNDANHISGPSRTGDGLSYAIRNAMHEANVKVNELSFINTHGTATVYNDEMEAKAIHLVGIEHCPVNSLKPYIGHTLGAAGIIESIICKHELLEGRLFATLGYEQLGVSLPLQLFSEHIGLPLRTCVKTASGFGGCNAAVVLALPDAVKSKQLLPAVPLQEIAHVSITGYQVIANGELVFETEAEDFPTFIRAAYKNLGEANLKFYKMDDLCKLGYVAAGYLLQGKDFQPEEMALVLANSSSSLHTDCRHQAIIDKEGDNAASPAVFVYTLANIVAGEICIRHKIQGESTFFIEEEFDAESLQQYARMILGRNGLKYCIIGWCDLMNNDYSAQFSLYAQIEAF